MQGHQICTAHLLRNLSHTMQALPDDARSPDKMGLLRDSVHSRDHVDIGQEVRDKMEKRLDGPIFRPPVYTKENGDDAEFDKIKKSIIKHRDYGFTLFSKTEVPPTNNDSGKALRPAGTKPKVSGRFCTGAGIESHAPAASVLQTAVQNGQNPFDVLRVIAALGGAEHRLRGVIIIVRLQSTGYNRGT